MTFLELNNWLTKKPDDSMQTERSVEADLRKMVIEPAQEKTPEKVAENVSTCSEVRICNI